MHCDAGGIDVPQVALRIVLEIIGNAEPAGGGGGEVRAGRCQGPCPHSPGPDRPACRGRSPQGFLAAPQVVLQDYAGHRAPLAHARTIADEEARTLTTGEQDFMLL